MKTLESNLNIQKIRQIDSADLYFMDKIVIVEIKLHTILGKIQVNNILETIASELPDLSQVNYISNKVEAYSIKPTEFTMIREKIDIFKTYAAVAYEKNGMTNLVFERMFLKKPIVSYNTLQEAVAAVQGRSSCRVRPTFVA